MSQRDVNIEKHSSPRVEASGSRSWYVATLNWVGDYSLQKSKMNDNNVISDRREDL